MKQSDITSEIIALSRKIAEYWRMEIYKGCWYCDIDILCLWHENYEPDFPDEVFPIPSISDCLEKLGQLGVGDIELIQDVDKWTVYFFPKTATHATAMMGNSLHEALLQALLAVPGGSHDR